MIKITFVCFADEGSASGALSFPPFNIASGGPFLCFVKIAFVCLSGWEPARDALSDALSFPYWKFITFGGPFLRFIKIAFVLFGGFGICK